MELTCVECGFVGDNRTHFDIPSEPGKGLCKDRSLCNERRKEVVHGGTHGRKS